MTDPLPDYLKPSEIAAKPISEYAPPARRKALEGLEKVLTPPPVPVSSNGIEVIKEEIKKLTHRQMQMLCDAICRNKDPIGRTEMPEVLDKFAHGD